MGTISALLGMFAAQTSGGASAKSPLSLATQPKQGETYGSAFMLSISHTTQADGSTTDEVSFKSYTSHHAGGCCGNGSGKDISSAFEQLLASLDSDSKGSSSASSPSTSGTSADSIMQLLESTLSSLSDDLQNAVASASANSTGAKGHSVAAKQGDEGSKQLGNSLLAHHHRHHHHHGDATQSAGNNAGGATSGDADGDSDSGSSNVATAAAVPVVPTVAS